MKRLILVSALIFTCAASSFAQAKSADAEGKKTDEIIEQLGLNESQTKEVKLIMKEHQGLMSAQKKIIAANKKSIQLAEGVLRKTKAEMDKDLSAILTEEQMKEFNELRSKQKD